MPDAKMPVANDSLVDNLVVAGAVYEQPEMGRYPALSVQLFASSGEQEMHTFVLVGSPEYLREVQAEFDAAVTDAIRRFLLT